MKIAGREAARHLAAPDPKRPLLIWGADPVRVAAARADAALALTGAGAEAEMRLARIPASDLRKDPAALLDAVKAQGFFPGPRAVVVEEAGDGLAQVIAAALADWRPGDAAVVVTAGALPPRSALRKLFETHPVAVAIALYDDPPGREEVEALLARAGATAGRDGLTDLVALARDLPPGDLRQLVEKLALYAGGQPIGPADIAACAPPQGEAATDDLILAVAEARMDVVGALMSRMGGQVAPVTLAIAALRHFRVLHAAAADPEGAPAALARARPPVPFRLRDRMAAQAQLWGVRGAEEAIRLLVETDLTLRSTSRAPAMAVLERALLRIAGLQRRR